MEELNVNKTERVYKVVRSVTSPVLKVIYKPIVLHKEVIPNDGRSICFAPNHRSTLDPFIILPTAKEAIHWAALKRFFDGEDSIFNNSKNEILCKITQVLFKEMGLIPIDRESSNMESLRIMRKLLKEGKHLGIFPEGTTNKHPDEYDIGPVKPGLVSIAKVTGSWIQPISVLWIEDENIKNKAIINYREPFLCEGMSKEEAAQMWIDEVQAGIDENREIISALGKTASDTDKKMLIKVK